MSDVETQQVSQGLDSLQALSSNPVVEVAPRVQQLINMVVPMPRASVKTLLHVYGLSQVQVSGSLMTASKKSILRVPFCA
jgi:hypothetical protein